MGDGALASELDQVTAELAAARIGYASLGARIAGLQARHAALSRAVSGAGQQSRPSASAAPGYRTDAIVAILEAAGTEMSINDVVGALRQAGRDHETYDNVGVDLAYLAERGRIIRARRGIYASASG